MKDTFVISKTLIKPKWYVLDATEKHLGRLATETVSILQGKRKTYYNPSQNVGDYVIVINAKKVKITGNKKKTKLYIRHSGRPGGKKVETFEQLQTRLPERIVEKAVKGMLPKNRLGRLLFTKLKVYPGSLHPHIAQIRES
jgi:large subunit ribosomal protein L13